MAETLLQFKEPVRSPDGVLYEARACASPVPGGTWQGWIEFVPLDGGDPVRSPRETTQPNRVDTEYWATGLGAVYLEGEYGINGLFVGVPTKLGANGIEEIIQINLTTEERAQLQKSAAAVQELVTS